MVDPAAAMIPGQATRKAAASAWPAVLVPPARTPRRAILLRCAGFAVARPAAAG